MSKRRTIELANLVVLFDGKGLVDSFRDRFMPAIKDGRVSGKGEVESYRFHAIDFLTTDGHPIMYGRLLKFMNIEAEQDYDENEEELIASNRVIPSVPSAFFVIDLGNHRISYLGETRRSPTLRDFEYCIRRLLLSDWRHRRSKLKKELLKKRGRKRLNEAIKHEIEELLDKALPEPDVRVTPLPGLKGVNKTLDPFKLVTSLSIKPLLRNNELADPNARFLKALEAQQDKLKSTTTSVNVSNSKEGLTKDEVKKLVKAAASGNYEIKVKGKDSANEDISSDLREVSVKFKETIPEREPDKTRAKRLLNKMSEAFQRGYILAARVSAEIKTEAMEIVNEFKTEE